MNVDGAQAGHLAAHRLDSYIARREPAAADVQAYRRGGGLCHACRCAGGVAGPLRHAARGGAQSVGGGEIRLRCEQLGIAQMDRKRTQVEQGKTKIFVEMLHIKFAEPKAGGAAATAPGEAPARLRTVDAGVLMRLVSRNAKKGAQFTPQGMLRWPLGSAKAEEVLAETRALMDALEPAARS